MWKRSQAFRIGLGLAFTLMLHSEGRAGLERAASCLSAFSFSALSYSEAVKRLHYVMGQDLAMSTAGLPRSVLEQAGRHPGWRFCHFL